MRTNAFYAFLLLQLFSFSASAQNRESDGYISSEPICGWDSLKSKIIQPEIIRRAGVWSIYMLEFSIDSVGNIEKFFQTKTKHFNVELVIDDDKIFKWADSTFILTLQTILNSTKWKHSVYNGAPFNGHIKVPIIINRFGFSNIDGILLNVPLPMGRTVW
jgi:hypothetical protein